ncbi:MAG: NADH:flavin oxidoreductase [bacterium]|nr:NADH:flavin oxidoreductase [bacterium]
MMNQDQKAGKSKYPFVFSTFNIGPITVPNRIFFPPWHVNYADTEGKVTDYMINFYTSLAKGGCGMVIIGGAAVSKNYTGFDKMLQANDDKHIPGLHKIFGELEKAGAVPAIQLHHLGRQSLPVKVGSDELIAPSAIPCPVMSTVDSSYKVREMTQEDIQNAQDDFVKAAVRSAEAGAKMIELNSAHGYLLSEFLSPYSNHRNDEYGGNQENRTRFIKEIAERIHAKIGHTAALSARLSAHEYVDGGLTPEDYKDILPTLEKAGIDFFSMSAGVMQSMNQVLFDKNRDKTPFLENAAMIESYTSLPVGYTLYVSSIQEAEEILASGKGDLIGMGRAQVADPQIVNKSLEGSEATITKCKWDYSCANVLFSDPQMYCISNPELRKP